MNKYHLTLYLQKIFQVHICISVQHHLVSHHLTSSARRTFALSYLSFTIKSFCQHFSHSTLKYLWQSFSRQSTTLPKQYFTSISLFSTFLRSHHRSIRISLISQVNLIPNYQENCLRIDTFNFGNPLSMSFFTFFQIWWKEVRSETE